MWFICLFGYFVICYLFRFFFFLLVLSFRLTRAFGVFEGSNAVSPAGWVVSTGAGGIGVSTRREQAIWIALAAGWVESEISWWCSVVARRRETVWNRKWRSGTQAARTQGGNWLFSCCVCGVRPLFDSQASERKCMATSIWLFSYSWWFDPSLLLLVFVLFRWLVLPDLLCWYVVVQSAFHSCALPASAQGVAWYGLLGYSFPLLQYGLRGVPWVSVSVAHCALLRCFCLFVRIRWLHSLVLSLTFHLLTCTMGFAPINWTCIARDDRSWVGYCIDRTILVDRQLQGKESFSAAHSSSSLLWAQSPIVIGC